MAVKNNLRKQVDLPVWEYCRFAPVLTTAISSLTTGNTMSNRYLYYQVSGLLYRYDTITDTWNQLASNPLTPTIMNNNVLSNSVGHYGQAISGDVSSIRMAGLSGNTLVGYKIRILSGTGAGQERVITKVSAPIIEDRGVVTTASTTVVIDASTGIGLKQWRYNRWKNYQVRLDYGTGRTQLRSILFNSNNSLTFSDTTYLGINPWAVCPLAVATVANNTLYTIESNIVTVDQPWTTVPDSTSNFVILSGGIWNITQYTTSSPFFSLTYYDLLADVWYQKSVQTGIKTAVFLAASDLSMERFTETNGALVSGSIASATSKSLTVGGTLAFTPMRWANFEVRIIGGTGMGQVRSILSNTVNTINTYCPWDVVPDATSTFEIWRDCGKLFLMGGGDSALLQYSIETDQWSTGKQFEHGQCSQMAAQRTGYGDRPLSLTSITRLATSITSINPTPTAGGSGYNINDILTIAGGTAGTARVTGVSTTGAVTSISLEACGSGYTVGTGKTTTVSPAGGTGCTLNILTVDYVEQATTSIVSHNLRHGDVVTISGATGTGAEKFNGTYTILGMGSTTTFQYCSIGDPGAASATFTAPSTTTLIDSTKNWAINEHAGKLIQLATNVIPSVGQVRRIVSNTANTITWTLAATAPANASRYIIEDIKPFGTDRTYSGQTGGGTEGFATSGTTTSLTDTTKNWDPNFWSRTVGRKLRIVEGTGVGNEITITSNTSNTLNFAVQTFTPDTTTRYIIMDTFGTATAGTTTTLTDANQNWATNQWIGKRVRFLSGTSQGNEYTITANTATQLTFATGTAPDTSTAYAILEATPKSFGLHLDMVMGCSDENINNKYIYAWTGSVTPELSRYDIASEHWELMSYSPQTETMTTGSMYCYDGEDRIYFWNGTQGRLNYYDIPLNAVFGAGTPPYGMGTAISGNRMEIIQTEDGLKYLYLMRHTGQEMWRLLLFY